MPQTQLRVSLSTEMAAFLKTKVTSGEYASESDVIRDGLRSLQDRDGGFEDWLKEKVMPALEALQADPSRARSIADVRASLAAQHAKALQHG